VVPLPLIELDRINVHLGDRHVLHDLSWRLEPGEQWAIVGANGSGKTTLLKVIAGDQWIDEDGGRRSYALDGEPQSVARAARQIGYVSPEQQERISRLELPFPGWAFVAAGLHDTIYLQGLLSADEEARVEALLERFGLRAIAARPVATLSFGELRRLLIARALVRAPRVLVLDEFANGLDREARADLVAFLEQVAHETHVICASHRFDDLPATTTMHARVVEGRIVELGPGRPHAPRAAGDGAPETPSDALDTEVLVEIRRADVYRGETLVLRDVEWEIRRGEHTLISGPNGSGKSTFAALLAGTLPAAYGARIRRFGSEGPFDVWELKRRIVHVSDALQIAYDRDPTVEQVIGSGFVARIGAPGELDREQQRVVDELMRRLDLERLAGRSFLRLSFGERRKVLIARGLVRRPEILILDEVWSGLDAPFRDVLRVLLDELVKAGTTLVVISHHDEDLPAFVRRTFAIEDGRLITASASASRVGR
jgi:molybdate transport system ATP-binding protein